MRRPTHLLLSGALVLLTVLPAAAEKIILDQGSAQAAPALRVLERENSRLALEFSLPFLEQEEIVVEGESYQSLSIPGGGTEGEVGAPGLPIFSRLVAVPEGTEARVRVISQSQRAVPAQRVFPVQEDGTAGFSIDRAAYDGAAPPPLAQLGQAAYIRDLRVMPLVIHPVSWDSAKGELSVTERLELVIEFTGADGAALPASPRLIPESFDHLFRDAVLNYERSEDSAVGPGTYLVIYPDDAGVLSRLQQLLDWRRRQGYAVLLATTTQAGGTNTAIKSYIQGVYNSADPPLEHVCLVGDANGSYAVPCWFENLSGYGGEGDHYYTTLAGGDILSDVNLGRLSFRSYTELETIVHKIVTYEISPPTTDAGWFTRATVAGDPSSSGVTTIFVNQWLKQHLLANGYSRVDTLWSPSSGNMAAAINQGLSVFGYRGWLGMSGMSEVGIGNLANGDKLPYAVIVTCGTGSFSDDTACRSEAFLRAPNGGGIGSVGTATTGTHTRYNNCYYLGAWEGAINGSDHRLGVSHTRGKLELFSNYQISQPNTVDIWCVWNNLMGDPATDLWMAYPEPLAVVHPSTMAVGANAVPVTVTLDGSPVEGARVALYKDGQIRSVGYSDFYGEALLPISGYSAGQLLVTATMHDAKPYLGSLTLGSVPLFVAYYDDQVDDDLLGDSSGNGNGIVNPGESIELPLALRNFGTATAFGIGASLSSADPYAQVVDGVETYGDGHVPPGGVVWSDEDFDFDVAASAPDGHVLEFELMVQGDLGSWTSRVQFQVASAAFQAESFTWSGPGGNLDPGESGNLIVTIRNTGSLAATGISATLASEDPWITVSDAGGSFGNIGVGATGQNAGNPFALAISPDCFQGHLASLNLNLSFNGGYQDVVALNLPVGSAGSDDPVGPDAYGYYAFDNTDASYPYCPGYSWVEIDPSHGGAGTDVGLGDFGWEQDDTKLKPLPFVFYYYGEPYTELSICSNGWIAMGETSLKPYRNWSIPGAGNPDNLIAPFWDNLYQQGTNRVYHWNDAENGRYVIQWSRVKNDWSGATENFEIILYDPAVYPTSTGDGQILFQYETVSSTDSENGYATVGIQNKDRTDGLLYSYWNHYATAAAPLSTGRSILFLPVAQLNLGTLAGNLFNASNGNTPVAGASVRVVESGQTLISTANGHYQGGVQEGLYTVRTQHPSFAPKEVTGVSIVEGETTQLNFLLEDILGPSILDTTVLPHTEDVTGPYVVDTWITDFSDIEELRFDWVGAGGIQQLPLILIDADTGHYRAEIPGQPLNTQVRYWITARDGAGNASRDPANGDTYMFWILESVELFADDMEANLGWTVGDTGDAATTGLWARVDPIGVWNAGVPVQPEDDASPLGTLCYITGNNESGTQGADDVDGGKTTLLSPWFNLSSLMSASVSYRRWYTNDTGNNPNEDFWVVEATGDGTHWMSLEYTNVSERAWALRSFDLEDYIALTGTVRLRFIASDLGAASLVEAGVDEFQLIGFSEPDATSLPQEDLPKRLTLLGAVPNPFNPSTSIRFGLPAAQPVSLRVYDAAGRLVRALLDEQLLAAGYHDISWNGRDDQNRPAGSGLYLYRIETKSEQLHAKMLLIK